jgi:uncharacterized protein YkwD
LSRRRTPRRQQHSAARHASVVIGLWFAWLALAAPTPAQETARAAQVLELVNREREAASLSALSWDGRLAAAAQRHAEDMAARGVLSHTGSDGSTLADRARRTGYGYRRVAENVAVGQESPQEVVSGWMDSPGHRRNILRPDIEELGFGYAEGRPAGDAPGRYWVIVLGRPMR